MRSYLSYIMNTQARLSLFGTVLEYYDYALYGFCAALLAQQLFPELDQNAALIQAYLIFFAGSLAKPVGALIFGWIGDLHGRRPALRWSMLGIVIPTLTIALIPSSLDSSVAMVCILCARLLQGIFIAGESDGVRIRLYESHENTSPFVINAMVGLSSYVGIFLASQGAFAAKIFPDYWRLPFLVGGVLGLFLLKARQNITESPQFKRPAQAWVRPNYRGLMATIMLCGSVGGSYHLFFVYQSTYWSSVLKCMPQSQAQFLTTFCLVLYIPALLIAAKLSEKFSGERVIITGSVVALMLCPFLNLGNHPNLLLLSMLSLSLAAIHSPGYVLLMRQFSMGTRYRHMSLGHSLGSLLMSGSAPLLATYFWQEWSSTLSFSLHFALLLGIGILAVILIRRLALAKLPDPGQIPDPALG